MSGSLACVYVFVLIFAAVYSASVEFNYEDQEAWVNFTDSQCGDNSQSPINVVTENLYPGDDIGLTDLVFTYLNDALQGTWENTGTSLLFTPSSSTSPRTVTTYRGTYELLQFHFHWGSDNDEGSEHTVNGMEYSGELHFVHRTTVSSASSTEFDYYTVVGILLQADSGLSAVNTVWEDFSNVPSYNAQSNISSSNVYSYLLPENLGYYYYNGSLTTPLCNQIVQWVLLETPLSVPSSFFEAARETQQSDGEPLTANFRDVQQLNGRRVYYESSVSGLLPSVAVILISLFVLVTFLY